MDVEDREDCTESDTLEPGWLACRTLPAAHYVRELIDIYLSRVHPVRCLGFLHIPTFMERFRQDDSLYADRYGLIYAICALAAPFYYAKVTSASSPSTDTETEPGIETGTSRSPFHRAGRGWAVSALQCLFTTLGSSAVECLSTACLLHEHLLRVGDHAKAFLVSGLVARHVQVLQLNMEHDSDVLCQLPGTIPWAVKESRRRLFWACYLQDAFIECGIDQLRLIAAEDVQIQLPCLEDYFNRNQPCLTEPLQRQDLLPDEDEPGSLRGINKSNILDLRAIYIRIMAIRSKVLRYVKHLSGDIPWDADGSEFQRLDDEISTLHQSMPECVAMTPANTYLYKSSGRLSVYFGVHILLAQTFNDLYRIGVAGLVFPNSASKWIREYAPGDFIKRCHVVCATKASEIAKLLFELYTCSRESMVDIAFAMHAQVCSGVLVSTAISWHALSMAPTTLPDFDFNNCQRMLKSNLLVLDFLRYYMQVDAFFESAGEALARFCSAMAEHDKTTPEDLLQMEDRDLGTAGDGSRQFSLDHILNPLGVYPIARTQVSDGHKPEKFPPQEAASWRRIGDESEELDAGTNFSDTYVNNIMWEWDLQTPLTVDALGYPSFLDDIFAVEETVKGDVRQT